MDTFNRLKFAENSCCHILIKRRMSSEKLLSEKSRGAVPTTCFVSFESNGNEIEKEMQEVLRSLGEGLYDFVTTLHKPQYMKALQFGLKYCVTLLMEDPFNLEC